MRTAVLKPSSRGARRILRWAVGVEAVAIFLAIKGLNAMGLAAYTVPAVAAVVGLHFLPLVALHRVRIYYATAPAIVLWLTCAVRLAAPRRVRRRPSARRP
jgi:hypothetical protein